MVDNKKRGGGFSPVPQPKKEKTVSLLEKLKWLRTWIKEVAKKFPDKYVRGFVDSLCLVYEFLDEIESIINYCDDVQLDYYCRLKQEMHEKSTSIRRKLDTGYRDKTGTWIPAYLTEDEKQYLIFVMLGNTREENRKNGETFLPIE